MYSKEQSTINVYFMNVYPLVSFRTRIYEHQELTRVPDRKISVEGDMLWHILTEAWAEVWMSKHVTRDWYIPTWNWSSSFLILIYSSTEGFAWAAACQASLLWCSCLTAHVDPEFLVWSNATSTSWGPLLIDRNRHIRSALRNGPRPTYVPGLY